MRVLRPAQWVAACGGLALALSGAILAAPPGADESGAVVACVNGAPIRAAALERALGRREGAVGVSTHSEERRVLIDRLVDEELLVQRAAAMGLVASDRGVRKALVRAAIDDAVHDASLDPPRDDELRGFHASNAGLFAAPRRVRVRAISFDASRDSEEALRRAQEAADAIASGLAFEVAAARLGDPPGLPVPDALLPEAALRRRLGPSLSAAALALTEGQISQPIRVGESVHLLQLAENAPARAESFDAARARVAAEFARRRGDEALAALLARLRREARIVRASEPSPS